MTIGQLRKLLKVKNLEEKISCFKDDMNVFMDNNKLIVSRVSEEDYFMGADSYDPMDDMLENSDILDKDYWS